MVILPLLFLAILNPINIAGFVVGVVAKSWSSRCMGVILVAFAGAVVEAVVSRSFSIGLFALSLPYVAIWAAIGHFVHAYRRKNHPLYGPMDQRD